MKITKTAKTAASVIILAAVIICAVLPCFAYDCKIGDLNRDGRVNSKDACLLAQALVGGFRPEGDPRVCDVNKDGKFNAADCAAAALFFVGRVGIGKYEPSARILENWKNVRAGNAINDFLFEYGVSSPNHTGDEYATLDFDALLIGDKSQLYDAVLSYQLETMSFGFERKEVRTYLHALCDRYGKENAAEAEEGKTYSALITDAYNHFRSLYTKYGPVTPAGVAEENLDAMHADGEWESFCHELLMISRYEVDEPDYVYFKGMTADEAVEVVKRAAEYYSLPRTETLGGFTFNADVGGLSEYGELFSVLHENGIGVWVTAEEENEIVCGALIASGLSDCVTGVIGSTLATDEARITVDAAEKGYPRRFYNNKVFTEYTEIPAVITSENKADAIDAVGSYYYGKGPVFTLCKSGETAACEFADTALALIISEGETDATADAAETQKDLGLRTAELRGDTLFVLQGADVERRRLTSDAGETKPAAENRTVAEIIGDDYHRYSYPDYAPVRTGSEEADICAMTFNVRCADDKNGHSIAERAPRVASVIRDRDPDVIGMQESTDQWLPYLYDLFGEDYEIYTMYRGGDREACPILFKKSEFRCLARGAFWLSDTPSAVSECWGQGYRICEYVKLLQLKSGREFVFINTHFGFTDKIQTASSRVVTDYARKISDLPTFVLGDFNMHTDWAGYAVMTEYFADVNAETAKDESETFHGYYDGSEPVEHIDYCFVDGKITPINAETVKTTFDGKYPSDHYPVVFDIKLK